MARDPQDRPSAAAFGEEIQRMQRSTAFPSTRWRCGPNAQAGRPEPRGGGARALRPDRQLPLELTSFVGRRTELAAVKHMLSSSRLVTLTGIGGVGKTRLALRAAAEARRDFPDGVWLVELGELHDGSLLVDVVAAEPGGARRVCPAVAGRAGRVSVLAEAAAGSGQLRAGGGRGGGAGRNAAARLPGAADPRHQPRAARHRWGGGAAAVAAAFPTRTRADPARTAQLRAVALFAERAAAAVPGFELTEENKATWRGSAPRLDGLPLAIELAAARLRAMSPEQILERLADRYALLTRGSRGAPTRQQTLSWSVDWSYDLCTRPNNSCGPGCRCSPGASNSSGRRHLRWRLRAAKNRRPAVVAGGEVDPDPNGGQRRRCGSGYSKRCGTTAGNGSTDRRIHRSCVGDTATGTDSWCTTLRPSGSARDRWSG